MLAPGARSATLVIMTARQCVWIIVMSVGVVAAGAPAWAQAAPEGEDSGHVRAVLDHETGPLYVLQNEGRYGDTGTEFYADDVGQQDNLFLVRRTSLELGLGRRHTVIFLYAPLRAVTRVTLDRDIDFRGTDFAAGSVVDHEFFFDGYRASYLFGLLRRALSVDVGASLQVRNAAVTFASADGEVYAEESDIGLVFAFKTRLTFAPSDTGPYAMLDADGFATLGQVEEAEGSIYDVAVTLGVPVAQPLDVVLRGRLYGGGADVPSQPLDNYGQYVSATLGARLRLDRMW